MKIAIIGTGISGLVCAHLLHETHELYIFEAASRIGGHTRTVPMKIAGDTYPVDTGFIVFNDRTYPSFVRLLARLGVPARTSSMSFSVRSERTGLEYGGSSADHLFAQRRNLLRPAHWRMVRDIFRFFREAPAILDEPDDTLTLGDFLARGRYSPSFVDEHLIPLGAALWSTDARRMRDFPAHLMVRFLHHHGMLGVHDRPVWKVVEGGSSRYVDAMVPPFRDRIALSTPVRELRRGEHAVTVRTDRDEVEVDHVIVATHTDEALALLADPTHDERRLLGAIPYQSNQVVLHTDPSVLPTRRKLWSSWNYLVPRESADRVSVSYYMNRLQSLEAPEAISVTLNPAPGQIDPHRIHSTWTTGHPLFTAASVSAQKEHARLIGPNRTSYCGAYWGFGFHEDGVRAALSVCESLGAGEPVRVREPAGVSA